MDKFEELKTESWLDYITREFPEDSTKCDYFETKGKVFLILIVILFFIRVWQRVNVARF